MRSYQKPPFESEALRKWLLTGLKETVQYRLRQTFQRDKMIDAIRSRIPSGNQAFHRVLQKTFIRAGFEFELLRHGDAEFHVIRKRIHKREPFQPVRRLVMVPGFGDTPASWLPSLGLMGMQIYRQFDEVLIIDFPGYLGFLSNREMIPSMELLLGIVRTVCEANPPTVLFGHSLGGWLAGKIAQELKTPMEHLVLLSPSGLIPEHERESFGASIVNSQSLTINELMERVVFQTKSMHWVFQKDVRQFYSKPEVKDFVESVKHEHFIDEQKPFQSARTSVIWGDHDRFVPVSWLRYWVECFGTHLDGYMMHDTGHLPQLERPKVFSSVFRNALSDSGVRVESGWKKVHARIADRMIHPQVEQHQGPKLITQT